MTKFLGKIEIQDSRSKKPRTRIILDADKGEISTGGKGKNGNLILHDIDGKERMSIGAETPISAQDGSEKTVFSVFDKKVAGVLVGAGKDEGGKKAGLIVVRDKEGKNSINMDGATGSIEVRDIDDSISTIRLNGNDGTIIANDIGMNRNLAVYYNDGKEMAKIGYRTVKVGGKAKLSKSKKKPAAVKKYGIWISDSKGNNAMELGSHGQLTAGGGGNDSSVVLKDGSGTTVLALLSNSKQLVPGGRISYCVLNLGGIEKPGKIIMRAWSGYSTIIIDAQNNSIDLGVIKLDGNKSSVSIGDIKLDGNKSSVSIGDIKLDGKIGSLDLKDSIKLNGEKGDIFFNNADCAEDFDISESAYAEPGTVMVIEKDGKLQPSLYDYDKRVVGVISGAGDYKPGLVLDKKQHPDNRKPISLMGKVYCKADAQSSCIEVGDLLTTSCTPGHAMKARDPSKAFGAVIGKALSPLKSGKALIPILITRQ